jgi:hypothetical protein
MQLAASRTMPIEEAKALPVIEQFLTNQKKLEIMTGEMKQLRAQAKIEYQGEFSAPEQKPVAQAPADSPKPKEPAKSQEAAVLEKGLSSIK